MFSNIKHKIVYGNNHFIEVNHDKTDQTNERHLESRFPIQQRKNFRYRLKEKSA